MENKFIHLENLIRIENKLINKIKFILHYCNDDTFNINHYINDFIEFYRVNFEFDNYKYIHDALNELKQFLYGTNEISPFLIQYLKKEIFPINTNLDYYSDRIKKDFEIDIDDMFIHMRDRSQNNLVFRFYLKVSDFGHSVELDKLIGFCKEYISKNETPKEAPKIQTQNNENLKDKISNHIDDLINTIDPNEKWEKVFFEKDDFDNYKNIIIEFLSDKIYIIPKIEIKIKPKSKSSIIGIFKELHDKYSSLAGHMIEDKKLFEVVKVLSLFKDDTNVQIYKRITSNRLK